MNVAFRGNRLNLSNETGFDHTFSALWLRESSFSPTFRDAKTGHKLGNGDALPLDIQIEAADLAEEVLSLQFSDGHQCDYPLNWLIDTA